MLGRIRSPRAGHQSSQLHDENRQESELHEDATHPLHENVLPAVRVVLFHLALRSSNRSSTLRSFHEASRDQAGRGGMRFWENQGVVSRRRCGLSSQARRRTARGLPPILVAAVLSTLRAPFRANVVSFHAHKRARIPCCWNVLSDPPRGLNNGS